MKKLLTVALALLLTCCAAPALASQTLRMTGSKALLPMAEKAETEEILLGEMTAVPGFAEIIPTGFDVYDHFVVRRAGNKEALVSSGEYDAREGFLYRHVNDLYYREEDVTGFESGEDADFALLFAEVRNGTCCREIQFDQRITVKVAGGDGEEYEGWVRQRDLSLPGVTWLDPADYYTLDSCFVGYYIFGCAVPRDVLDAASPLRMEITVDGVKLVYTIR